MKTTHKKFITLLNAALNQEKYNINAITSNELSNLKNLAHAHQLEALIFSAFDKPNILRSKYPDIVKSWEKVTVLSSLRQKMNYVHIEAILEEFQKLNIPVLPLKGVYLRNLYPQPDFRTMGDADLLIHHEDYEKVKQLLLTLGYKEIPDDHPYHTAFVKNKAPSIEVHWALTNGESFNAEAIKVFQEQVWGHAIPASIGKLETLSFSNEDTCIYLVIHMAKHLKYTGFGLRQVCDLYLLLNRYRTTLNWQYIQSTLKAMGLYPFFSLLLTSLHTLFYFSLDNLPLNDLQLFSTHITSFFINEIFESGTFGGSSYEHSMSSFLINGEKNNHYVTSIKSFIFPPITKLKNRHHYCEKITFLIPIAWFHNLFCLVFRKDVSFSNKLKAFFLSDRNKKKRLQLFKSLDL